ncbi:MAG TPA: 50S ribosomal protein L29 [Candidatus Methanofastidiosa archaeon]|nr:50S ribosomal protein L29 [Candidatus Methanofastidiosa archaeon]
MSILKTDEIRDMNLDEMESKLDELRFELARERALLATGSAPENPGRIRELKRTIARLSTIINQTQTKGEMDR